MLKVAVFAVLAAAVGYLAGLLAGVVLVHAFSSNSHDKAVEAAVTGALVVGPACAVLALLVTLGYCLLARSS